MKVHLNIEAENLRVKKIFNRTPVITTSGNFCPLYLGAFFSAGDVCRPFSLKL
jgi:hypothetical protein